jgi:hypothetical protein
MQQDIPWNSRDPKVGAIVYSRYSPQQYGEVLEVIKEPKDMPSHVTEATAFLYWKALVRWEKKGRPATYYLCCDLKCYLELIIEHERKADTMRERVRALRESNKPK